MSYLELVSSKLTLTSLITVCWCRESGVPEQRKDYLPSDKQFLVTKNGMGSAYVLCTHYTCNHTLLHITPSYTIPHAYHILHNTTNCTHIHTVPCYRRCHQMNVTSDNEKIIKFDNQDEEGWVDTHHGGSH